MFNYVVEYDTFGYEEIGCDYSEEQCLTALRKMVENVSRVLVNKFYFPYWIKDNCAVCYIPYEFSTTEVLKTFNEFERKHETDNILIGYEIEKGVMYMAICDINHIGVRKDILIDITNNLRTYCAKHRNKSFS